MYGTVQIGQEHADDHGHSEQMLAKRSVYTDDKGQFYLVRQYKFKDNSICFCLGSRNREKSDLTTDQGGIGGKEAVRCPTWTSTWQFKQEIKNPEGLQ